LKVLLNCL